MAESISKELKEIEHLTIIGKYYEAIKNTENILELKELSEKERVRALILQSKSFSMLGKFEFREEYLQRSLELSLLAFNKSKKLNDLVFTAEALTWNVWVSSFGLESMGVQKFEPNDFLEKEKQLNDIYEEMKIKEISVPKKTEALILLVLSLESYGKAEIIEQYSWDRKEDLELLEKGLKLINEVDNKENRMFLYWFKAQIFNDIGDYDNARNSYEFGLSIAEELSNEYFISFFLYQIGMIYWQMGELNLLYDFMIKSLEFRDKLGNIRGTGQIYFRLGVFYGETGEWKRALEHFQKGYDILSEKGKIESYNSLLMNIGVCFSLMGDVEKALKYSQIAYETNRKLGKTRFAYQNLTNIGLIHASKGDLDKALELYEEILAYYEKTGYKIGIFGTFNNMGRLYFRKGMFYKAIEFCEKALVFFQDIGNKTAIISTLNYLAIISSEHNRRDLAEVYQEKLVEIAEDVEYKNIKRLSLVSEAVILKNSTKSRERIRAEVLLDQLLQEDLHLDLQTEVLFHLCDLLLKELKATSDEKILVKLQKYVSRLIEIGTAVNFPYLTCEILWFKSQLSLIDADLDTVKELLNQAQEIAEEKGFNLLALKIIKAKEQLIKQTIELEDLGMETSSISQKMNVIKVENGFKRIKNDERFALNIEKLVRADQAHQLKHHV